MQSQLLLAAPRRPHPFRHAVATTAQLRRRAENDGDVKLFALSFTAFFVCFYTFFF